MYLSINAGDKILTWVGRGADVNCQFTLTEPTDCDFTVIGRWAATGHAMNEVYLPMLTRVDSGARVWQPPENLNATGGGSKK